MTNNKNNSASELNDPQGIDRSLLEYLKPKSEDRYSKLEAYCDLLTRATSGTYSTSVVVGNLRILPGQFVATISEIWTLPMNRILDSAVSEHGNQVCLRHFPLPPIPLPY